MAEPVTSTTAPGICSAALPMRCSDPCLLARPPRRRAAPQSRGGRTNFRRSPRAACSPWRCAIRRCSAPSMPRAAPVRPRRSSCTRPCPTKPGTARISRPLPGDEGLLAVTLQNLTEHKRLEQLRSDFIANASHELRTPLTSLVGFIDTLLGPAANDDAARERFLTIMRQQAARMSALIDDLLSLSRIEMRQHLRPTGQRRSRAAARSKCATGCSTQADEAGVEIELEGPDERGRHRRPRRALRGVREPPRQRHQIWRRRRPRRGRAWPPAAPATTTPSRSPTTAPASPPSTCRA